MSSGYTPGDIIISNLTLSSSRGSLDLKSSFITASVYESIFTPGIIADIDVLDTDDQIGNLKVTGDEIVKFTFQAPGGEDADYTFALHKLTDGAPTPAANKSKTYRISCVSKEMLHSKTNYVQKNYDKPISEMVKDIVQNYMKSNKQVDVEETKGKQKILISGKNPLKSINMIRKRAVSNQNKSSLYIFFENHKSFNFTTIENLFNAGSVKTFNQSDALGHDLYSLGHDNIIAYEVPQQFNSIDRIKYGGKRRVAKFNARTWEYEYKDKTPDTKSFKSGGSGGYDSRDFAMTYYDQPKIPPTNIIPVDASSGERPNTGIPEAIADQQAYLATLMQNAVKIKVPGDSKLKAGDVITANIPQKIATSGSKQNDPLLSGDFLVTRIHHQILTAADKPRYTCVMELVKGNLEEGV